MLSDDLNWLPIKNSFLYLTENEYRLPQKGDIYEFGIYNATSLELILQLGEKYNLFKSGSWLFGFDSFEGLPPNNSNFEKFKEGSYKSDFTQVELAVKFFNEPISIIKSWYKNLNESHVRIYNMRPAKFIHIDCDLYESTIDALTFMFENKLVQKGTIIAYNEFSEKEESKAHWEMVIKYNAIADEIWRWKYIDKDLQIPVLQKIFEIVELN